MVKMTIITYTCNSSSVCVCVYEGGVPVYRCVYCMCRCTWLYSLEIWSLTEPGGRLPGSKPRWSSDSTSLSLFQLRPAFYVDAGI